MDHPTPESDTQQEPLVAEVVECSRFERMTYDEVVDSLIAKTSYKTREYLIKALHKPQEIKLFGPMHPHMRANVMTGLQRGVPMRWRPFHTLVEEAKMDIKDQRAAVASWLNAALAVIGIKREELDARTIPELEKIISHDKRKLLKEAHQVSRGTYVNVRLTELSPELIQKLAEEGDTQFLPHSEERLEIMAYRSQHDLPVHHKNDINHKP